MVSKKEVLVIGITIIAIFLVSLMIVKLQVKPKNEMEILYEEGLKEPLEIEENEIKKNGYSGVGFKGNIEIIDLGIEAGIGEDIETVKRNIEDCVIISYNFISIDTDKCPELDRPARIFFEMIPFTDFTLLRDNKECPNNVCSNIVYNSVTQRLSFDVTGFTNYSVVGNTALRIWDNTNDAEGWNRTHAVGEYIKFYANYSDSGSSAPIQGVNIGCNISFNLGSGYGVEYVMDYNATSKFYEINRSFNSNGTFLYNVTCEGTAGGYQDMALNDDFVVTKANVIFLQRVYEFNVTRIDNYVVYLNYRNNRLNDDTEITFNKTAHDDEIALYNSGPMGSWQYKPIISPGQEANTTLHLFLRNATKLQYNFTIQIFNWSNDTNADLSDTALIIVNLPNYDRYNLTVTPADWNFSVPNCGDTTLLCEESQLEIMINNTGDQICSDLDIKMGGDIYMTIYPAVDDTLEPGETKNYTIWANVNSSTPGGNSTINISGCFNNHSIVINYTVPVCVWAATLNEGFITKCSTESHYCGNRRGWSGDCWLVPVDPGNCDTLEAELYICTTVGEVPYTSTYYVNGYEVYKQRDYDLYGCERIQVDPDYVNLNGFNRISVSASGRIAIPCTTGGTGCVGGYSYWAAHDTATLKIICGTNPTVFGSQYCAACTPETSGTDGNNITQLEIWEYIDNQTCIGNFSANYSYYEGAQSTATVSSETDCTDGVDNDCDFLIDCNDDDCCSDAACIGVGYCPEAEICDDGIDNDFDGDKDCFDLECCDEAVCDGYPICRGVSLECGDVIWSNTKLYGNMDCSGAGNTTGLYLSYLPRPAGCIGQNDIVTLDCDGFTIKGPSTADTYGIYAPACGVQQIWGRNTHITNCIVEDFDVGIYYMGRLESSIKNSILTNNIVGIRANMSRIDIQNNTVTSDDDNAIGIDLFNFGFDSSDPGNMNWYGYGTNYLRVSDNRINLTGSSTKGIWYHTGRFPRKSVAVFFTKWLEYNYSANLIDNVIDVDEDDATSWGMFFQDFYNSTISVVMNVFDGMANASFDFNSTRWTNFTGEFKFKGVDVISSDPVGKQNISRYLNIVKDNWHDGTSTLGFAKFLLKMYYTVDDILNYQVDEDTISMYERGGIWSEVIDQANDTANNYIFANITNLGAGVLSSTDYGLFGDYQYPWTFISGANCTVNYTLLPYYVSPGVPYNMTEYLAGQVYWHNHTATGFPLGVYYYTVQCNKTGYETQILTDEFEISSTCSSVNLTNITINATDECCTFYHTFTANYTNTTGSFISGANCNVTIDGVTIYLTETAAGTLYQNDSTWREGNYCLAENTYHGYDYNISCYKEGYELQEDNSTLRIYHGTVDNWICSGGPEAEIPEFNIIGIILILIIASVGYVVVSNKDLRKIKKKIRTRKKK